MMKTTEQPQLPLVILLKKSKEERAEVLAKPPQSGELICSLS